MKNLESFSSQELTMDEMKETNGGVLIIGTAAAIAIGSAFVAGFAAGVALYAATEDND